MNCISTWRYLCDYFLGGVRPSVSCFVSEQILADTDSLVDWHVVIFITHLKGKCQKNVSGFGAVRNFK